MGLYDDITRARQILEIPEEASFLLIEKKYKEALKMWHPDTCRGKKEECEEKTREILIAGKLLLNYCRQYPMSFSREEIEKHLPTEELLEKKFGDDPMWGNPNAGR